jgi:dipeptidyl aminopeptidase/acylaminoacyl peptidase
MLLFKDPAEFACGAALRPVTDWATYHPGYTQPRLGNLNDEPDVYKKTSPIHFAEGLEKPLLILHGMMDSNVFVQDSVRLIERLIKLGKDFDAMLYPSQDHAFTDSASWIDEYRRIERFFDQHLKGAR